PAIGPDDSAVPPDSEPIPSPDPAPEPIRANLGPAPATGPAPAALMPAQPRRGPILGWLMGRNRTRR
ncbi:MAG TPA: hypothetical protein VF590_18960, partial [Isosphaeraceae bacterium]